MTDLVAIALLVAAASAISLVTAHMISMGEELPPNSLEAERQHAQHDHEAFLGEYEAKKFDGLPAEESQRRLGLIVDRIDKDGDGFVTLVELTNWIDYAHRVYIDESVGRVWRSHNPDNAKQISWDAFHQKVYGSIWRKENFEYGMPYDKMVARDRRLWTVADKDHDDCLTLEEYATFLHPEEDPAIRHVIVHETMMDMDMDNDGKISVDEYISEIYRSTNPGVDETVLNMRVREEFGEHHDLDNDGYLNEIEMVQWLFPKDQENSESEAKHLILETDQDHDGRLTKAEMLAKSHVFVGSQATNFGKALSSHDEL